MPIKNYILPLILCSSLIANQTDQPSAHVTDPYYYTQDANEYFGYAEWIYWNPMTADPMNWGGFVTQSASTTVVASETFRNLQYDFSSGFRVGLGYRLGCDTSGANTRPWQLEVEYTRLHTSTSDSEDANGVVNGIGSAIEPLLPTPDTSHVYTFLHGNSHSSLDYDRIDLRIAWPFWMQSNVILRPFVGGTVAWFENDWHTFFSNTPPATPASCDLDWTWWGGGLLGGADAYVGIGNGLGFFADSSFGFLFGPLKTDELDTGVDNTPIFATLSCHSDSYSFQPVVNFGAGVDYKYWFNKAAMLHIALGWEFTWWFDMNRYGRVNQRDSAIASTAGYFNTEPSGLGYQGFTARLGLDF